MTCDAMTRSSNIKNQAMTLFYLVQRFSNRLPLPYGVKQVARVSLGVIGSYQSSLQIY